MLARTIKKRNLLSKESHLFQIWKNFQQNYNNSKELQKLKMKKKRLKKRNEKEERRAQRLLQKKMSQDEDGEVQDLAVLKRIK